MLQVVKRHLITVMVALRYNDLTRELNSPKRQPNHLNNRALLAGEHFTVAHTANRPQYSSSNNENNETKIISTASKWEDKSGKGPNFPGKPNRGSLGV
jgi:hypothetical protein